MLAGFYTTGSATPFFIAFNVATGCFLSGCLAVMEPCIKSIASFYMPQTVQAPHPAPNPRVTEAAISGSCIQCNGGDLGDRRPDRVSARVRAGWVQGECTGGRQGGSTL